jgi:hypothetical protein
MKIINIYNNPTINANNIINHFYKELIKSIEQTDTIKINDNSIHINDSSQIIKNINFYFHRHQEDLSNLNQSYYFINYDLHDISSIIYNMNISLMNNGFIKRLVI